MTLEDLQTERDALPADSALPASATQLDLRAVQRRRADLDARLAQARAAVAVLAQLGTTSDLERWRAQLEDWRKTLCVELLAFESPIKDKTQRGRAKSVEFSIVMIDRGPSTKMAQAGIGLENIALGQLMRDAGYVQAGGDPALNFVGVLPWYGSLAVVERRLKEHATKRAAAQAQLDEALMDDAARAQRDAEQQELRTAYNRMRVKVNPNLDTPGLVVIDRQTGDVVDETTLSPLQRRALEAARTTWFAEVRERPVVETPTDAPVLS